MKSRVRISQRSGFALLMAVLLISLAGILLAGIARYGLSVALRASDSCAELQSRWGLSTLQRIVARQAATWLHQLLDNQQDCPPLGLPVETEFNVGALRYRIRLDDESAKLNLNRIYATQGAIGLRRALETLSLTDIAANLMTCTEQGPFHLETWGQVFSNSITFSQPTPEFISSRAQLITLWGNGRINIRRASDLVIEAACRDIIGENKTELLLELRRKNPESNLKSLLEKAALDSAQLSRLEDLLSDSSNCYSLWLTVTSSRTSETEFIVLDENGEAISRIYW